MFTVVRYNTQDREAALLGTAILTDHGIVTATNTKHVVDRWDYITITM